MTATIEIDPTFRPFPECKQIPVFRIDYPSGCEPHVRVGPLPSEDIANVLITMRPRSMDDLFRAMAASNAIRAAIDTPRLPQLFMPYLPHARQDRIAVPGDAFSLSVVVDMLAGYFSRIHVFDPHNQAAIEACHPRAFSFHNATPFINAIIGQEECKTPRIALVFPDEGAAQRFPETGVIQHSLGADKMYRKHITIQFRKKRDPLTGSLEFLPIEGDLDVKDLTCIVVDDICDGGGTFIPVAKQLRQSGAGGVVLAVSHGIFSKGISTLLDHYDTVHCTNSFQDVEHPRVVLHNNWNAIIGDLTV